MYLSIDSFSTKLENAASKVVKDGQLVSTSLTYEDQHQPQRKVSIMLVKKKTTNYLEFIYMCLTCNFYPLYISILVFLTERDKAHTQEPNQEDFLVPLNEMKILIMH